MRRLFENFAYRAVFDDLPGIHYAYPVRYVCDDAKIVRNVNNGHFELLLKLLNQAKNLCLYRNIKRGGRLITNQDFGAAGNRRSDDNALAHAA